MHDIKLEIFGTYSKISNILKKYNYIVLYLSCNTAIKDIIRSQN
jgi:hypothetical protein